MWNTEKCLNSDSGPLANMSRWPAGLMLYPAASPCTAREPQQTCLDIPQLIWPIILSHVPNAIGRVGGIFTLRNNRLNRRILEAKFELSKVNGHRFLRVLSLASSSQKVTENADLSLRPKKQAPHWSNWKTRELPMQRATWLVHPTRGPTFWWRSLVAAWQSIKGSKYWYDEDMGNWQRPPYSPRKKSRRTQPKGVNLIGQIYDFD